MKKQIITVINQKGGVGKTTTAHTLGAGLTRRGFRVLFVDLDPQTNLSFTLRADAGPTSYDMITDGRPAAGCIQHRDEGDIIPASPALTHADTVITGRARESRLAAMLKPIRTNYDYIIIDTPPALGILTINALTASDSIVITAQADAYSLQAIRHLADTLTAVRTHSNPALTIRGILITRLNPRTIIGRDLSDMMNQAALHLGTTRFTTMIREITAVQQAQANQADIFTYQPKSKAADDYNAFITEFLERE